MEPTKAPWADAGSARSASNHDTLVPSPAGTTEPVQNVPASFGPVPTAGLRTGRPVERIIHAEPQMPEASALQRADFRPATKRIQSQQLLTKFLQSGAARDFVAFILSLNEAVKGKDLSAPCDVNPPVSAMLEVLDKLSSWVDENPPVQQSLRYGNPAYRTWYDLMAANSIELLKSVLPPDLSEASTELKPYLMDSFGNRTRIDYGTGHETNFCALLYCIAKLRVFTEADRQALVTRVFKEYLFLMRKLQTTYWLEPAGSHGVWGLDDCQFLPFLWGSAQLIHHPMIRPKSIHNQDILDNNHHEYFYLGAVRFVKQVKKGPLPETSPIINDISSVPNWSKVNSGMVKMYEAEVLSKLPIMQHFLFGSLMQFPTDD